ncbi:MAG: hypothetical protein B6D59_03770 [Campylobacteraceae bacterium 4484_4]|nr:MAG: hypothetical protein B6D59_03770 [Campylobacteraceae bacterium 4484_4]
MSLKQILLNLCYRLAASPRYREIKKGVYEILEDETSHRKHLFDSFMIFLVLSTVMILVLEIKHQLPPFVYLYENIAVVIFIIEWLGRLWVSSDAHVSIIEEQQRYELEEIEPSLWMLIRPAVQQKIRFVLSPMSIIDLLAILPSYRPLRILRFFLLFRLFKIFRYTQSINFLMRVFVEKRFEFFTLLVLFAFMVFFAATVIFIFEGGGENPHVNNFFDAIYWAVVTITTVGFGDITPHTLEGRFVTIFLIVGGLGIISFVTSIITTSMTEKLNEVKAHHMMQEAGKLKQFLLVCGYSRMSEVLAETLTQEGHKFLILDTDESKIAKALKKRYLAMQADATDIALLRELQVGKKIKKAVVATEDDAINASIILSLKSIDPDIELFTRANERKNKSKLYLAGAKEVIFPYESASIAAIEYLGKPVAFDAIDNILLERHNPVIEEIEVVGGMKICGEKLSRIGIKKYHLKVMGVIRGRENRKFYFHPKADQFTLQEQDILLVIGDFEDIAAFKLRLFKG